jgi:type II secretory pathway component PulF
MFISMIKVAEARGGVPETLHRLSRHYEARQNLIRQARSAMIYPIAVLLVAAIAATILTVYVLPVFVDLLKGIANGVDLPWVSRALMGISDFVGKGGWWMIPLTVVGLPFVVFRLYRTRGGKDVMDRTILYVPVFGKLLRKIDTTRFARTLSALLGAGVDVGSSLDLTADVLQLEPHRKAIRDMRRRVLDGDELSEALEKTGRFTPDVVAVVNTGEETGKLPESLDRLADNYEEQVAYMVKNMGQLVQPLITVLLGIVVAFIVFAFLLPYISAVMNLANGAAR